MNIRIGHYKWTLGSYNFEENIYVLGYVKQSIISMLIPGEALSYYYYLREHPTKIYCINSTKLRKHLMKYQPKDHEYKIMLHSHYNILKNIYQEKQLRSTNQNDKMYWFSQKNKCNEILQKFEIIQRLSYLNLEIA